MKKILLASLALLALAGCGSQTGNGLTAEGQTVRAKLTHAEALSRLRSAGIGISSSGNCSDRNNRSCTSLEQIRSETIDGIMTLKRASSSYCSIIVTGGTETGHSSGIYSHWNGYKIDIKINSCVSNYITQNFKYIGTRSDGARQYRSAAGNIYAKESNHWDILYY